MIALVEGAERNKTPNEIALFTLLTTLTIIFLVVIETLYPIASYLHLILPIAMLIALTVCLYECSTGGFVIFGDWYCRHGSCYLFYVLAKSGRAVEVCGDVDVMILDKTGTITYGNRIASEFLPVNQQMRQIHSRCLSTSSIYDDTP